MQEDNFTPPKGAILVKKNNFTPPKGAILVKKKVATKSRSQEELWGSNSQPQDLYTSLATGVQEKQQASDGLDGVKPTPKPTLFPETPMGRPASSVMYEEKKPVLVESLPIDAKPKKFYRIVADEKKEVEKQILDLEERNTRLGRRPEDLTTEGTYQALQQKKVQLDDQFDPARRAIKQIQKESATGNSLLESIVSGATQGRYSYLSTEVIKLDKEVEDKLIDRFDSAPEEVKAKWYQGRLPLEAKEEIINSAKSEVITGKYKSLKQDADNYLKNIKDNPSIPLEQKLSFQKEFKERSDDFNAQIAIDYSGELLKNNFKKTGSLKDLDEGILSKYEGFLPDTLDILSTFAEGSAQVAAKVLTGIPSMVLIGSERFNQLTGMSKPDDYTAIEATEDWINDTTNLNFLPSSQTKRGNIVTEEGDLNVSYYSIGKTLAKTLPFTLKIMSDVKKGRMEGTPQSMISQLINPKYNKDFADKLRVVETAYKGTISDNYRDAKDMGMDDSKSFLYANIMSLAEGVSENIMPDYKYFDSLTGSSLKAAFKGGLKQAVTKQAAKNVTKDFFKNFVLETGEEEVILAVEDALKYSLLLNHENSEFFNMSRQKELIATTAILSGALGTFSVNKKFNQNKTDLYNNIHKNIYDLQDSFLQEIESPLNDQKAKDALITAYKFANDVSAAISKAPENVTADQIDLLVQKKNLEEKKKTIDTAFHPDINEEIAAIDTKIRELANMPSVEEVAPVTEEIVKPTEEPIIKDNQIPLKRETFEFESAEGDILDVQVTTRKDGTRLFVAKDKDGRVISSQSVGKDNTLTTEEYVTKGYGDIQGEVKVEQGNDIMAPAMKDKLTPKQKIELGIEDIATEKPVETTEAKAKAYSEELDKTKEADPDNYWSVSPVSVEDAAKGTIIDTEDGSAIVKPDGDIAGLFKKATSKAKGVAQDLLKRAVAAGGKKLDNFDTYLTPQYIKAGFRVVSRVPFNEEYAPEGWNKEKHGTPDVVAMVYDPDGKLDIKEKTFDDYDEAMAYRDSLLEPSIDAELEGLAKLFDESDNGFKMSQVDKARAALKDILPGTEIIIHNTTEEYSKAVGDNSRGAYIKYSDGRSVIHINKQNANGRTVAHEVFHAVILDKIKGDKSIQEITARMMKAVYKTASPALKEELDNFAEMYNDESIRDEEKLAELIGIIADGYPQMSPANKGIIKRWLDALAKMLGRKPFTDNEVIDMLNTLARKVSTGDVVSEQDIDLLNNINELNLKSEGSSGDQMNAAIIDRKQIKDSLDNSFKLIEYDDTNLPDNINMPNKSTVESVIDKSGGAAIFINSDGTKVGIRKNNTPLHGGWRYTYLVENQKDDIGFAATSSTHVKNMHGLAVKLADVRDSENEKAKGKPIAVFVTIQNAETMLGEWYAGEFFMEGIDKAIDNNAFKGGVNTAKKLLIDALTYKSQIEILNKKIKENKEFLATAEDKDKIKIKIDKLNNQVKNKLEKSKKADNNKFINLINSENFNTHDGRIKIAKELSSKKFSFGYRVNLLKQLIPLKSATGSNKEIKKALLDVNNGRVDFYNEHLDEVLLNKMKETNYDETSIGGVSLGGFFMDPYISFDNFYNNRKNGIKHAQFNESFTSNGDTFLLDSVINVNKLAPEMGYPTNEGYSLYNSSNKTSFTKKNTTLNDRFKIANFLYKETNNNSKYLTPPFTSIGGSMYTSTVFDQQVEEDKVIKRSQLTDDKNVNPGFDAALEASGETDASIKEWEDKNGVNQKQVRTPEVKEAAEKYYQEEITQEEFLDIVKKERPIKPLTKVPAIPTFKEIIGSLDKNKVAKGIVGLTKSIKEGSRVASRLDIPAYERFDTWVVSVHDGVKEGFAIAYGQTAVLKNVEFISSSLTALNIARGRITNDGTMTAKTPMARIFGDWTNENPQSVHDRAITLMNDPDWVQVGMNPFRYSWFYDKTDGMPLKSAEEVVQVGALVLAKKPVKVSPDDPMFKTKSAKGNEIRFQQAKGIDEMVRIAKEAKYTDAAISAFLKAKGFSETEIEEALKGNTVISEEEAYDKFNATFKKSKETVENKKTVKQYLKGKYQNIIKNWSNRQVQAQSLLSKTGMVNTLNLSINSHGYSGKAKRMFQESYDKIFKGLSTEKREILDKVIQAKRFIAIDNNRAERGLDPVKHPDYINKDESQKYLDKLKKEIGDEAFYDINSRAKEYFKTYKKLLKDVYENGLISEEAYDSMSDVDYQPRVFLQFVTDFEGDLKTNRSGVDGSGLGSSQIKAMNEGDVNSLVTNSEWLLSNSLVARTNAMAQNNINKRFMTDEFPNAKKRFDELDPKNLKGDDVRFYKYFKELESKIIDNPIVGIKEDGSPKYMYEGLKAPLNFTKAFYYVNGVQRQFFMEDSLYASWTDSIDGFLSRDTKELLSYASGSALVKAIATGNNPAFPIVNTPRDFMFTAAFSDEYSNLVPKALVQIGADVTRSIREIAKKDSNIVKKYYEYGGAMDFLSSQGVLKKDSVLGAFLSKMVSSNVKDNAGAIFNTVTLKKISEYSELMFRLGIFQRSVNNSLKELGYKSMDEVTDKQQVDDIYNAAVASARGILDFNKGGVATKDLESIIPYINVAFQGGSVALNAFKKHPAATTSRIFQIATMASTIPAGISLILIAANKDDDDDKTVHETYLDALAGISKYQKSKYMNIVTGLKNEDGQYMIIKIAKAQELSPVISITDDMAENIVRQVSGKELKSNANIASDAMFSLKSHVLPFDVTSPSGIIVRNPMIKAILTYQTGYDFFRDEPLAMNLESKPAPYEGIDMKNVEGFYKELGPSTGLSPIRSKAFVESLITTPDTNPFVGMLYGGAEAMTSNKESKDTGDNFLKLLGKSTVKRLVSYTSDFNRNIGAKKELEEKIDDIKLKDAIMKSDIKLASDQFLAKDISKEELMERLKGLDLFDKKRAINKIRDKKTMKGVDGNIIDIKYEKDASVKALMISSYYGDIFDNSDDSKDVLKQMIRVGNILTPEVRYELSKYKK